MATMTAIGTRIETGIEYLFVAIAYAEMGYVFRSITNLESLDLKASIVFYALFAGVGLVMHASFRNSHVPDLKDRIVNVLRTSFFCLAPLLFLAFIKYARRHPTLRS